MSEGPGQRPGPCSLSRRSPGSGALPPAVPPTFPRVTFGRGSGLGEPLGRAGGVGLHAGQDVLIGLHRVRVPATALLAGHGVPSLVDHCVVAVAALLDVSLHRVPPSMWVPTVG